MINSKFLFYVLKIWYQETRLCLIFNFKLKAMRFKDKVYG
jgi:hypothetical protein